LRVAASPAHRGVACRCRKGNRWRCDSRLCRMRPKHHDGVHVFLDIYIAPYGSFRRGGERHPRRWGKGRAMQAGAGHHLRRSGGAHAILRHTASDRDAGGHGVGIEEARAWSCGTGAVSDNARRLRQGRCPRSLKADSRSPGRRWPLMLEGHSKLISDLRRPNTGFAIFVDNCGVPAEEVRRFGRAEWRAKTHIPRAANFSIWASASGRPSRRRRCPG